MPFHAITFRVTPSSRVLTAILAAILLGPLAAARASTQVVFGTIVAVDHERHSLTIFAEMFNYIGRGEGRAVSKSIGWHDRTLILLDGEVSTAAEALKPGRAVMYQVHGGTILVSSKSPGMDAVRRTDDPANAIHRFTASKAVTLPLTTKKGAVQAETDVEFVVDVVDGRVADAVAMPFIGNRAHHDLDAAKLSFVDGKLTGTAAFAIAHPAVDKPEPVAVTVAINTAVTDGAVGGTCTFQADGQKTTAKAQGRALPRAPGLVPGKAWMRLGVPGGPFFRDHIFAVFDLVDGKARAGGHHWYHKGKVNGSIDENSVTLADGRLTGKLRSSIAIRSETLPHVFAIDARVIGNRYLFGSFTLTVGDATHAGFVRGGLVPADSPVSGYTKALDTLYKERFPKKKKTTANAGAAHNPEGQKSDVGSRQESPSLPDL